MEGNRQPSREVISRWCGTYHSNVTESQIVTSTTVTNFELTDEQTSTMVSSHRDETFDIMHTVDGDLADFFARPIRVCTLSVPLNSSFGSLQGGSKLYMQNTRVRSKMNNFKYVSGTMHFKAVVTGTAFHYGKIVMAYEPWPTFSQTGINGSPVGCQLLQLPHVSMDISSTSSGELSYALLHPYGSVDLLQYGGQDDDPDRLIIASIGPVLAVGDTTLPVTISIWAWMTDVKLSMPTTINLAGYQNQSYTGRYHTEINVETPDKPPSFGWMIRGLRNMTNVIMPYAKASYAYLGMGLEIAQAFGLSRPTLLTDCMNVIARPLHNLCSYNVNDNSMKLSLDSKQEVTIDPSVLGLGNEDELTVVSLGSREFLTDSFFWSALTPIESCLKRYAVSPYASFTDASPGTILSPATMVALPFKYWRGTVHYRIEIIASAFHKGSLRILFDPSLENTTLNDASCLSKQIDNIVYSQIVDISTTRNYEFCVGMGTSRPYLRVPGFGSVFKYSPTDVVSLGNDTCSGVMAIQVAMPLTSTGVSPSVTSNDVIVHVYTRMGDDFEVAQPYDGFYSLLTPRPVNYSSDQPSGNRIANNAEIEEIPKTSFTGSNHSAVQGNSGLPDFSDPTSLCVNKVEEYINTYKLSDVCFGERIFSIRQLIKRYSVIRTWFFTLGNLFNNFYLEVSDFPCFPYPAGAVGTPPLVNRYTKTSPLHWYGSMFVAWRGGTRHKYIQHRLSSLNPVIAVAHRVPEPVDDAIVANTVASAALPSLGAVLNPLTNPTNGAISIHYLTEEAAVQIETPYSTNQRFHFVRFDNDLFKTGLRASDSHRISIRSNANQGFDVYNAVAAADDFSFHQFRYTPRLLAVVA